jgi:hypothetical protein
MKTHGEIKRVDGKRVATPEYRSWQMMKNRCLNPRARDYARYGGRGITLCKRWYVFETFLEDMGRRPSAAHTLERLNTEKGYTPRNCCWATREVQARNRGYATTRAWELAEKLGVKQSTANHYLWIYRRALRGLPSAYTLSPQIAKVISVHLEHAK